MSWFALAAVLFVVSIAGYAQQPVTTAPAPPWLYRAKNVFLSNAGSDSGLFPHPFSGDPDRPYNEFYSEIKRLGRFHLVDDPANADLVLELRLNAPSGPAKADKTKGASDPLPMFRLTVWDGRTHYVLWALTESIEGANLQKTHDRNFDEAIAALVQNLQKITTPPSKATP